MNEIPNDFTIEPFPAETIYELRISGRLGNTTRTWFEDMTVTEDESGSPVQSIIQGPMRDQAALYGLISRIRDLGLTLLSVQRLDMKKTQENSTIMEKVLSTEFGATTGKFYLSHPEDWVIEEDGEGNVLAMANSRAALDRFHAGKVQPGDFAMNIGFIPAAWFARAEWADVGIQLGAAPDVFLQSIMPMVRLTKDYAESAVVSASELVSLSAEVEAGLLIVSNDQREGMFIVFEVAAKVFTFVTAVGYPGEMADFQEIASAIAATIEYTGSAQDLTAAFFGD